ncbi:hypothetical protein GLOIN_2v1880014 [Rhizophagus irregularis DAOM 181602=DAOM 197198]|uniref:Uncharacterized protein n=1 Tax=Rhizophagus irregularis (strain DAOM 181602 / DAOM 197198 / MUCL 43194) TaxID=747089 RepID=A0A2P4PLI5_RHIID|nr:hypothetical protein GLOIN_2v1880014 [Rhizophagus irregularis DAOM 181602=DAOM 197198]POG66240.1 hypothetical protein GLOIN_2v1880014 [Rhizophagus irregularis DAOM 181602=DAOM 197198]|eukprot:XP_025173106.1 hypothetical protein GLOIN_2v1880014 [Rhizophagus irregularis DAOM 181602=DAOM 197198]
MEQALLSIHIHFYNSASYTFQEENGDYQKINVCIGNVVGIASVKVESFADVKAILKLPWNDGQDYIFTYYLFEDVSSTINELDDRPDLLLLLAHENTFISLILNLWFFEPSLEENDEFLAINELETDIVMKRERASSRIIKHLVLWEVDNIVFTECRTKRRVNINGEVCPEDIYENVNSKDRAASRCGSVMGCWQAVV